MAVAEALSRLENDDMGDRNRLRVPTGWALNGSTEGWGANAVKRRVMSMTALLHPDKFPEEQRARATAAIQMASLIGQRISDPTMDELHTPSQATPQNRRRQRAPVTPSSCDDDESTSPPITPMPNTPPDVRQRKKEANKLRDQLLDVTKTNQQRLKPPVGSCRPGLKWSAAAVQERVDAFVSVLFSKIPTSSVTGNTPHWQAAFDALYELQELVVSANAPPLPRSPQSPADPHDIAKKFQGEGALVCYWMSTTHTVTCRRGKKIDDESVRHAAVERLLVWLAPILSAGEGLWIAMGPKTWSISRERGTGRAHNHGQGLVGALAISNAAAKEMLTEVCKLFDTGDDRFYFDHEIHDKGDNRTVIDAMGYTVKDGGGGVQCRKNHYLNFNNFGDTAQHEYENLCWAEWFAKADTSGYSWEKSGFDWAGDTSIKKIVLKKSTLVPQVIVQVKRDNLLSYDVTFIKRTCWVFCQGKYALDPTLVIGGYGAAAPEARLEALSILSENPTACLQSTYEMGLVLCGPQKGSSVNFDGLGQLPRRRGLTRLPRDMAMQLDVFEAKHHFDTGQLPVRLVSLPRDMQLATPKGVGLIVDLAFDGKKRPDAIAFSKMLAGAGFEVKNIIYEHSKHADPTGELAVGACVEMLQACETLLKNFGPKSLDQTPRIYDRLDIADFMYLMSNSFDSSKVEALQLLVRQQKERSRNSLLHALFELYSVGIPENVDTFLHPGDERGSCYAYDTFELSTVLSAPMDDGLHLMFGYSTDDTDPTADDFDFDLSNLSPGASTVNSVGRGHIFFCSVFKWSDADVQEAARRKQRLYNTPSFLRSQGKLKTPTPTPRRAAPPASPVLRAASPVLRAASPVLRECTPDSTNVRLPDEDEDEEDLDFEAMEAMDSMGLNDTD